MAKSEKKMKLLSAEELSIFCSQIAMIMKSGITVGEGIYIMLEDNAPGRGKDILKSIHDGLDMGETFCNALQSSGAFPDYVVNMTRIGEQTGNLEKVMFGLGEYYEREQSISKNIKNAVMYPMIMILMMVFVIGVLLVEVLPIFNQVFTELGSEMSGIARAMMDFGSVVSGAALYILIAIVAIIIAFFVLRLTPGGKEFIETAKKKMLGGRKLQEKIAAGRFASAMSMMLASGLDVGTSLELTEALIDYKSTKEKIKNCGKAYGDGKNFADSLVESKLFSGMYARMISVANKTGTSDVTMAKIAAHYEEDVDIKISNTISIIEPTLVAVLCVIVGLILMSVMLPLMGIMSTLG